MQGLSYAFILLGLALVVGKVARELTPALQRAHVPTAVIAGLLLLAAGPDGLGAAARAMGWPIEHGVFGEAAFGAASDLPGALINIVFAALFLGRPIPKLRELWDQGGPHLLFGVSLSLGQYVIGFALALFVLGPWLGLNPLAGALIEPGMTGGHGTIAGLADTFEQLDFPEGEDLGLGLATIGVISGVVIGIALINWGDRRGWLRTDETPSDDDRKTESREVDVTEPGFEPLSFHLAVVMMAIGLGWVLLQGLIALERYMLQPLGAPALARFIPLFPLAMVGGAALQLAAQRLGLSRFLVRKTMAAVSGLALDLTIASAIATVSLSVLASNAAAFTVLTVASLAWTVLAYLFLTRWMIPRAAYHRGLGDFGQATGMVASGLLLIRISSKSTGNGATRAFSYKQLMFEPFFGGGLVTAAALPLTAQLGATAMLIGASIALAATLASGYLLFGRSA